MSFLPKKNLGFKKWTFSSGFSSVQLSHWILQSQLFWRNQMNWIKVKGAWITTILFCQETIPRQVKYFYNLHRKTWKLLVLFFLNVVVIIEERKLIGSSLKRFQYTFLTIGQLGVFVKHFIQQRHAYGLTVLYLQPENLTQFAAYVHVVRTQIMQIQI